MKRRNFAKITGFGLLAMHSVPGFAITEILNENSAGNPKVPLGLCNHSLRSMKLNAQQLIEYAIQQKLDSVLFNTFEPFENLETPYFSQLKKLANNNGVSIYIGVGSISEKSKRFTPKYGNAEELLAEGIRVAKAVGSPIVGCRIGSMEDRYMDGGIEAHTGAVTKTMKSFRQQALDAGIKFAFENHIGDLRSDELLDLISTTGTDICGALFDPANALWAMEDPMKALNLLGSSILCSSVRDVAIWQTEQGAAFQGMAIGKGFMDFPSYSKTMAELCPGVPLHVETISNAAREISFLNPEFWKGFPDLKTSEINDFLNLVWKGKPIELVNPPAGISQKDFDIKLQQSELLESIEFLRKNCNCGLKT